MNLLIKCLFVLIFIPFLSCKSLNYPSQDILDQRMELRSETSYILDEWNPGSKKFDEHHGYIYELSPGAAYYPIWFEYNNKRHNGIIFKPEISNNKTVLIIHGFAGNLKGFRFVTSMLLNNGYNVAALMLPGHSIDENPRGDIDDFSTYGKIVNSFVNLLEIKKMKPEFAVAHSTGASSLLIYNQDYGWKFKKVIFIAPLIRSVYWFPSSVVRTFTKPFIHKINTKWNGVLAVQVFPMHWFDELIKWNKVNKKYNIMPQELLILQGEKDDVVDWRYNLKYLKSKYPQLEIVTFKKGTHTMFMSDKDEGEDILNIIKSYLNSSL